MNTEAPKSAERGNGVPAEPVRGRGPGVNIEALRRGMKTVPSVVESLS